MCTVCMKNEVGCGGAWMNYFTVGVENLVEQLQYTAGPSALAIDGRVEIFYC